MKTDEQTNYEKRKKVSIIFGIMSSLGLLVFVAFYLNMENEEQLLPALFVLLVYDMILSVIYVNQLRKLK